MLDDLIGGRSEDAETLWVLMGNDHPAAIWRGTKTEVEQRLEAVKGAQRAKDDRETGPHPNAYNPRVNWRVYSFGVETLGTPPDTLSLASRLVGVPVATLRALMHGWAYAHPVTATHEHRGRGTWYSRVAEAELQCAWPPREGEMLTVYIGCEDGKWWARPKDEFDDGRFKGRGDPT